MSAPQQNNVVKMAKNCGLSQNQELSESIGDPSFSIKFENDAACTVGSLNQKSKDFHNDDPTTDGPITEQNVDDPKNESFKQVSEKVMEKKVAIGKKTVAKTTKSTTRVTSSRSSNVKVHETKTSALRAAKMHAKQASEAEKTPATLANTASTTNKKKSSSPRPISAKEKTSASDSSTKPSRTKPTSSSTSSTVFSNVSSKTSNVSKLSAKSTTGDSMKSGTAKVRIGKKTDKSTLTAPNKTPLTSTTPKSNSKTKSFSVSSDSAQSRTPKSKTVPTTTRLLNSKSNASEKKSKVSVTSANAEKKADNSKVKFSSHRRSASPIKKDICKNTVNSGERPKSQKTSKNDFKISEPHKSTNEKSSRESYTLVEVKGIPMTEKEKDQTESKEQLVVVLPDADFDSKKNLAHFENPSTTENSKLNHSNTESIEEKQFKNIILTGEDMMVEGMESPTSGKKQINEPIEGERFDDSLSLQDEDKMQLKTDSICNFTAGDRMQVKEEFDLFSSADISEQQIEEKHYNTTGNSLHFDGSVDSLQKDTRKKDFNDDDLYRVTPLLDNQRYDIDDLTPSDILSPADSPFKTGRSSSDMGMENFEVVLQNNSTPLSDVAIGSFIHMMPFHQKENQDDDEFDDIEDSGRTARLGFSDEKKIIDNNNKLNRTEEPNHDYSFDKGEKIESAMEGDKTKVASYLDSAPKLPAKFETMLGVENEEYGKESNLIKDEDRADRVNDNLPPTNIFETLAELKQQYADDENATLSAQSKDYSRDSSIANSPSHHHSGDFSSGDSSSYHADTEEGSAKEIQQDENFDLCDLKEMETKATVIHDEVKLFDNLMQDASSSLITTNSHEDVGKAQPIPLLQNNNSSKNFNIDILNEKFVSEENGSYELCNSYSNDVSEKSFQSESDEQEFLKGSDIDSHFNDGDCSNAQQHQHDDFAYDKKLKEESVYNIYADREDNDLTTKPNDIKSGDLNCNDPSKVIDNAEVSTEKQVDLNERKDFAHDDSISSLHYDDPCVINNYCSKIVKGIATEIDDCKDITRNEICSEPHQYHEELHKNENFFNDFERNGVEPIEITTDRSNEVVKSYCSSLIDKVKNEMVDGDENNQEGENNDGRAKISYSKMTIHSTQASSLTAEHDEDIDENDILERNTKEAGTNNAENEEGKKYPLETDASYGMSEAGRCDPEISCFPVYNKSESSLDSKQISDAFVSEIVSSECDGLQSSTQITTKFIEQQTKDVFDNNPDNGEEFSSFHCKMTTTSSITVVSSKSEVQTGTMIENDMQQFDSYKSGNNVTDGCYKLQDEKGFIAHETSDGLATETSNCLGGLQIANGKFNMGEFSARPTIIADISSDSNNEDEGDSEDENSIKIFKPSIEGKSINNSTTAYTKQSIFASVSDDGHFDQQDTSIDSFDYNDEE